MTSTKSVLALFICLSVICAIVSAAQETPKYSLKARDYAVLRAAVDVRFRLIDFD